MKLGLDPSDFTKGQKEATKAQLDTEKTVKKSSESMSRSIVGFTGKLLGVVSVALLVKKALTAVSDLSVTVRQLGIDSRNFGIAASEMRNFQNIGEMFGSKAEGVTKSIGDITAAVYNLAYNGQISDSLVMLGRLGVQFQTTTGQARSFRDIVLETEKAIQQRMRGGSLSRENANQMLLQAGFDPGIAQAILDGSVSTQLAQQESRRQISSKDVALMTEWEKSATSRDQEIAATAIGLPTTTAQAKSGIAGNKTLEAFAHAGKDAATFSESVSKAASAVKKEADVFVGALQSMSERLIANGWMKGRENYERTIQDAARKHGVDPEMLAGVLATESNFDPAALNPQSGARGIAQLMPKFFPNAGKNPHEDIDTAAGELRRQFDFFKSQGLSDDDAYYRALQGYNAGQTRISRSMQGLGKPLKQETLDYPGKVLGYAAGAVPTPGASNKGTSSNSTAVNIGEVNIQTQATDADGIASNIAGATRRKMLAAQADAGMT